MYSGKKDLIKLVIANVLLGVLLTSILLWLTFGFLMHIIVDIWPSIGYVQLGMIYTFTVLPISQSILPRVLLANNKITKRDFFRIVILSLISLIAIIALIISSAGEQILYIDRF